MGRLSANCTFRIWAGAIALAVVVPACVHGEWSDNGRDHDRRPPVYQRRAFEWMHGRGWRHDDKDARGRFWQSPQVNAGWFQRPYPYHLDYYRMRYGGSYAPYFGNLYGPPQVVTAPPYYGPYYGDFGQGYSNGYNNGVMGFPQPEHGVLPDGIDQNAAPSDQPSAESADDNLPSPAQ